MPSVIARFSGVVTFSDGSTEPFGVALDDQGVITVGNVNNANVISQVNDDQTWITDLMALLISKIPFLPCLGNTDKEVTDMVAELSGRIAFDDNTTEDFLIQFDTVKGAFIPSGGGVSAWLPAINAALFRLSDMFQAVCEEAFIDLSSSSSSSDSSSSTSSTSSSSTSSSSTSSSSTSTSSTSSSSTSLSSSSSTSTSSTSSSSSLSSNSSSSSSDESTSSTSTSTSDTTSTSSTSTSTSSTSTSSTSTSDTTSTSSTSTSTSDTTSTSSDSTSSSSTSSG